MTDHELKAFTEVMVAEIGLELTKELLKHGLPDAQVIDRIATVTTVSLMARAMAQPLGVGQAALLIHSLIGSFLTMLVRAMATQTQVVQVRTAELERQYQAKVATLLASQGERTLPEA